MSLVGACSSSGGPSDRGSISRRAGDAGEAISGYVYDFTSGAPLPGARVYTDPASAEVTSGEGGVYVLDQGLVAYTTYAVCAELDGYAPNHVSVTMHTGALRSADIPLTPVAPELGVSPLTLEFDAATDSLGFEVQNLGAAESELLWEAVAAPAWVASVTPSSGSLAGGVPAAAVTVALDRAALGGAGFGSHSTLLTVASNGGVELIDLRVDHPDPDAPHLDYEYAVIDFGADQTEAGVTLTNDGTGTLNWTASEALDWLTLSPASGSLAAGQGETVALAADRTSLDAGSQHAGFVAFDSDSVVDDALPLRVHISVAHTVGWSVTPGSIDLGDARQDAPIRIENQGSDSLDWTATSDQSWARIVPSEGRILAGDTLTAYAMVDKDALPAGPFSCTLTFSSDAGEVQVGLSGANVPHPNLLIGSDPLYFMYSGQADPTATLRIGNVGSGALRFSLSSDTPWVSSIEPSSGSVVSEAACNIPGWGCGVDVVIHADPEWFAAPEEASGILTVESPDTAETVEVPLHFVFSDRYFESLATPAELGERWHLGLVYDELRDRAVLFGGEGPHPSAPEARALADGRTWELDGSAWQEVTTASAPAPRYGHQLVYDRRRGVTVLVGGFDASGEALEDTWTYDGADWIEVLASGSPLTQDGVNTRSEQVAVFDPERGGVVFYGLAGRDSQQRSFWLFDGDGWAELPTDRPPPMTSPAVLLYLDGALMLQRAGMVRAGASTTLAYVADADFDWAAVETSTGFLPRVSVAVDPLTGLPHQYGGSYQYGVVRLIAEVGFLSRAAGGLVWAFSKLDPPHRTGHGLVFDSRRRRVLLVDGWCQGERDQVQEWDHRVACIDSHALNLFPPTEPRTDLTENPVLGASPATLDFGTVTDELILTLENSGDGVLDWIAPPPDGVSVDPDWGRTAAGETTVLTVSVDRAALGVGTHALVLPVRSDGGDEDVTIDVVVE